MLSNRKHKPTHSQTISTTALFAAAATLTICSLAAPAQAQSQDTTTFKICAGGIVTIEGTEAGEVITGTDDSDVILAHGGNDVIVGLGGEDRVCAGNGDDVIAPGVDGDSVLGGAGQDRLDYSGAAEPVAVDLYAGTASTGSWLNQGAIREVEHITGSALSDRLVGDGAANTLDGGGGDDWLQPGAGDDSLAGGPGDDELDGGSGSDWAGFPSAPGPVQVDLMSGEVRGDGEDEIAGVENIVAQGGDDTLIGNGRPNIFLSGAGDDTLVGHGGDDVLRGEGGVDTAEFPGFTGINVSGVGASGTVSGVGRDSLAEIETLIGSSAGDQISTYPGLTTVDAGDGGDVVFGGSHDETMRGGEGLDTVYFIGAPSGATIDLSAGTATGGTGNDSFGGFETIFGTNHADVIGGSLVGASDVNAHNGDDVFINQPGLVDVFSGGAGTDTLDLSSQTSPAFLGCQRDINGGQIFTMERVIGTDYRDSFCGAQNMAFDAGEGRDLIDYKDRTKVAISCPNKEGIQLATGQGFSDQLIGFERYHGSKEADTICAGRRRSSIDGFLGADVIKGSKFGDTIVGDQGDDELSGRGGADNIYGSGDHDQISGGSGDDEIAGQANRDDIECGSGRDTADTRDIQNEPRAASCERLENRPLPPLSGSWLSLESA